MVEYNSDLALIVRYDGTKEAFNNEVTNNLNAYKNKVVFICGNNGTQEPSKDSLQAIWVSDARGGRYLDTASFEYIRENLDRISTVKIGDTSLVADGASTLSMRPKSNGGISIGTDTTESGETVIEFSVVNKADLDENGKILISQLPDYMRGLMFGGIIKEIDINGIATIDPSEAFSSRFENITSIANTPEQCGKYAGIYFISNTTGLFANKDIAPKDWVLSTGSIWDKIDNSDSVSSVAGLTGSITASALAEKLSKNGINNELALKSEVDGKYEKPATGIPLTDLAQSAQTAIGQGTNALRAAKSVTSTYISAVRSDTSGTPTVVVGANTKNITSFAETEDGLATTADVRKFLSAMLNVKVVSVKQ